MLPKKCRTLIFVRIFRYFVNRVVKRFQFLANDAVDDGAIGTSSEGTHDVNVDDGDDVDGSSSLMMTMGSLPSGIIECHR